MPKQSFRRLLAAGLLAATLLAGGGAAVAQDMDANQIVDALTPKPELQRGLKVKPGEKPAAPSINMRVQFAYDSDELENEAILTLRALGAALTDKRLASYSFEIIGHTDAKGSAEYNLDLSRRRAASVVEHLVFFYHIPRDRLLAIGKGESEPINAADPEAGENRRVEIVNVGG